MALPLQLNNNELIPKKIHPIKPKKKLLICFLVEIMIDKKLKIFPK
jgi:hypothetical protein